MPSVIKFPIKAIQARSDMSASSPRAAKLAAEDDRFLTWFYSLAVERRADRFTLHEIKTATGIPLTRLPTVLLRNRWRRERDRYYKIDLWRSHWD